MPAIIMELAPLEKEKKARLVREVTESTSRATGLPPEAIFVFIKENSLENIGVGGTLLADRR
ncbi:MAG: 4-oxalocrotonate tautomerase family protein [Desulfovibrio sp.]|uniref:4-oxalocrotonate tautomerase DmpI n=1 Tax=Desulfovibrio sp. TaxID=885 RepID=UPI001A66C9BB|nr:4-oxalocrotonate tautomerase DmpI [Desulfovibrio sp.]MBD5417187.1 4-oxalocrotonate tautomerase family protein [Desulfovibrio sp.]